MSTSDKWFFRLGGTECAEFLWTGSIRTDEPVNEARARKLVAKAQRCKRLPAHTIVVSDSDLESGWWDVNTIINATTPEKQDKVIGRKLSDPTVHVPSFSEIQKMLAGMGL